MQPLIDRFSGPEPAILLTDSERAVTRDELAALVRTWNVELPELYLALLLAHNGGTFDLETVVDTEDDALPVHRLYPVVHGSRRVEDVLSAPYRPEGFFPFAEGLGACEFCFRLDDQAVYHLAYDGDDPPERVADSFAAFLENLGSEEDDLDDDW